MSGAKHATWVGGLLLLGAFATPHAAAPSGNDQEQSRFSGQSLFVLYCASCHGTSARGDGPLADSLRRRPPDLTTIAKANQGKFDREQVHRIIDGRQPVRGHGGPDMPVWGDAFSRAREDTDPESVKEKIDSIVRFLESIQERSGANDPQ
jgi:mono/diheme cytochrome c family protein